MATTRDNLTGTTVEVRMENHDPSNVMHQRYARARSRHDSRWRLFGQTGTIQKIANDGTVIVLIKDRNTPGASEQLLRFEPDDLHIVDSGITIRMAPRQKPKLAQNLLKPPITDTDLALIWEICEITLRLEGLTAAAFFARNDGGSKSPPLVAHARWAAWMACRALTGVSNRALGRIFGGVHGSTILCGLIRFNESIEAQAIYTRHIAIEYDKMTKQPITPKEK